jgi:hypothetical protein
MIAPLLGEVTVDSLQPDGIGPKSQFTSTHQFLFKAGLMGW